MNKTITGFNRGSLRFGFTVIELLVAISVIGVLATIVTISFSSIQKTSRDAQRSSRVELISEALEKYYDKNGEYPSCVAMKALANTVTSSTLPGLDPNVLATPTSASGTNSISTCSDLSSITGDFFAYTGDTSTNCTDSPTGYCTTYTLQYREESSGQIKSVTARRQANLPVLGSITASAVAVSVSQITLSWSLVANATSYSINMSTSADLSSPTVINVAAPAVSRAISGLTAGTRYYFNVSALASGYMRSISSTINASTMISTPAAPTVTSSTVGVSTTFSWTTPVCSVGTASYQYRYTISPSGYDSGWVASAASPFVATTSTEAQTYTINVQAKCTNAGASSAWSVSGNTSYYRARTWKQLASGLYYTCGIASDNLAYCWGKNNFYQLGDNTATDRSVPTPVYSAGVLSGKTIKYISASNALTCVIASDDNAYCWGSNYDGGLGNNSTVDSAVPVAVYRTGVLNGKTIKSIVTSSMHACAIASDNNAYCWGHNSGGELGNNSFTRSTVPVAVYTAGVLSGKTVKTIGAGASDTCVVASDDKAYCWGYNDNGNLGDNSTTTRIVPVAVNTAGVLSGATVLAVYPGDTIAANTCAIATKTGSTGAYCWGYGAFGALGNNSTTQSLVPVAVYTTAGVLSGKTVKSMHGRGAVACVVASDDKAYCWGYNNFGQLGNNSTTQSSVPVAVNTAGVLSGKTIKSISVGGSHTCAIGSDDRSYCWGRGSYGGALGDGLVSDSSVPVLTY
ncbi:prepilin-type N-terminal cleavage/methylation domain-containing protein [Candidatus Saccharibacteria bacterium]|nr:prepilin-type N-terminal cleavage/methylation domain-containing protein [Candidatus Saccharibacteria bacterium]